MPTDKEIAAETVSVEELLKSLRWKADMVVTNDFNETVWLTECYNKEGKRIGITDCCLAAEPCDYHKELERGDVAVIRTDYGLPEVNHG